MNNQIYNYYFNIQQTFFNFFLFQNLPTDWTTDKTGKGLPGTLVFPVLYIYVRDKKKGLLDLLFSDVSPFFETFPRDVLTLREGVVPNHPLDIPTSPRPPNMKW